MSGRLREGVRRKWSGQSGACPNLAPLPPYACWSRGPEETQPQQRGSHAALPPCQGLAGSHYDLQVRKVRVVVQDRRSGHLKEMTWGPGESTDLIVR